VEGSVLSSEFPNIQEALKVFFLRKGIDIVFAQFGITGVNVLEVCRGLSIPLIVHFHGFDAYARHIIDSVGEKYQEMFNYSSSIVAVSKDMISQLKSLGASKEKIVYAPYGVEDIFFENKPSFSNNTFISVGRFVSKKAPHLTLAAFREVLNQVPDSKLIMIGAGSPLLEACMDLAYSWKINEHVEFLGILDRQQVLKAFSRSFCFLQHSVIAFLDGDAEGTPLAIIEASAAGLPVISTKHKGINEAVIHDETGYLVEERDIENMSKYMIDLIRDKEKAQKMGICGRKHMHDNFNMKSYIGKLNDVIQSALPKAKRF